jgi:uncharacterized protein YndB with AHSA1/START domain
MTIASTMAAKVSLPGRGATTRTVAVNEIHVDASPERVFEVLSDPSCYAEWVVGTTDVPEADAEWPAEGSEFRHERGIGPLRHADDTIVVESEPPRRIVLDAKLDPLGTIRITLELEPRDGGTAVRMTEEPVAGVLGAVHNPLSDALLRRRNDVSLDRLRQLAEKR